MTEHEFQVTRIEPTSGFGWSDIRELFDYRELLWVLTVRQVRVRYSQTLMGFGWAIFQPVVQMVVFSLVFGMLAKMPSDGIPYPLFAYAGLLPWQFFSRALTAGSSSLIGMKAMMEKVYLPRLVAPISAVLTGLVDFAIASTVLFALLIWYGSWPGWSLLAVIPMLFLCTLVSLGVSLWLAGAAAAYRDVTVALPFVLQIWMYLTPVVYPLSQIPTEWRLLYSLNPMVGVMEGFRWAFIDTVSVPDLMPIAVSTLVGSLLAVTGVMHFARVTRNFIDRV